MAAAAVEMLKSKGLSQKVITVGVGADQQASRALVAGDHNAEVDLMPEIMAQHAFDAAVGLATTGHWQYDTQIKMVILTCLPNYPGPFGDKGRLIPAGAALGQTDRGG